MECLNCGKESEHVFCSGECKRAYRTAYGIYFSARIGDDDNGDGSQDNPYKTYWKAFNSVGSDDYEIINLNLWR